MNKIKMLYSNNPISFIVFVCINIVFHFSVFFIKPNIILYVRLYTTIITIVMFINRIMFQKSYLEKKITNVNNVFTISIKVIICYIKYFMYLLIPIIIIIIAYTVYLVMKFENVSDSIIHINYIEQNYLVIIVSMLFLLRMLIFCKLIFIENILVEKNNTLNNKDLVKKSFEIVMLKKYYILGLYLFNNIFMLARVLLTMFVKNIYFNTVSGVITSLLYCIYVMLILIFYAEQKAEENKENNYGSI